MSQQFLPSEDEQKKFIADVLSSHRVPQSTEEVLEGAETQYDSDEEQGMETPGQCEMATAAVMRRKALLANIVEVGETYKPVASSSDSDADEDEDAYPEFSISDAGVPAAVQRHPSLSRIHAVYASQKTTRPVTEVSHLTIERSVSESSLLPVSSKPAVWLILAGDSQLSVFHHLGVIFYLMETGRLFYVESVFAEGWACHLALLLKAHWKRMTTRSESGSYPRAEDLHSSITAPLMQLLAGANSLNKKLDALINHWSTGSVCLGAVAGRGPDLHLCVRVDRHSISSSSGDTDHVLYYSPEALATFTAASAAIHIEQERHCAELTGWQGASKAKWSRCLHAQTSGRYLWSIVARESERLCNAYCSNVWFHVSDTTPQNSPPISTENLVDVFDVACLRTCWEFCAFVRRLAEEKDIQAGVVLCSGHDSNALGFLRESGLVYARSVSDMTLQIPRACWQPVIDVYQKEGVLHRTSALNNSDLIANAMHVGFVVAWSSDMAVEINSGNTVPWQLTSPGGGVSGEIDPEDTDYEHRIVAVTRCGPIMVQGPAHAQLVNTEAKVMGDSRYAKVHAIFQASAYTTAAMSTSAEGLAVSFSEFSKSVTGASNAQGAPPKKTPCSIIGSWFSKRDKKIK